ncbi:MAG: ATP-dependent RNA helicase SrmB, partial [Colwellia sp.]
MFEQFDLDSELLASIKKIGYTKPTSIQDLVIPEAMVGKDILASAP